MLLTGLRPWKSLICSRFSRSIGSRPKRQKKWRRSVLSTNVSAAIETLEDRVLLSTLTVNSALDEISKDDVLTLREAILLANGATPFSALSDAEKAQVTDGEPAAGQHDTFQFDLPGPSISIQPEFALPKITDAVTIDGYTQLDVEPNTNPITQGSNAVLKIELDGSLIDESNSPEFPPPTSGLHITAGGSTVRGLVINRFPRAGIRLQAGSGNVIEGNFLGTDVSGTQSLGTQLFGVEIQDSADNVRIGGTDPAARNLISGNKRFGVVIGNSGSVGNQVLGNFIGTDITGMQAVPNLGDGVLISKQTNRFDAFPKENVIGGTEPGARNVISGNGFVR